MASPTPLDPTITNIPADFVPVPITSSDGEAFGDTAPTGGGPDGPFTVPQDGDKAGVTPSEIGAGNVVGAGSDQLVLVMSEEAYEGDAEFTVSVDGQQIGGIQTVTTDRWTTNGEAFTFKGNWAPGPHRVQVTFTNNQQTQGSNLTSPINTGDRNLYINSATFDGTAIANVAQEIASSPGTQPGDPAASQTAGEAFFNVTDSTAIPANAPSVPTTSPAPVNVGSGADELSLSLAGDPFEGNPEFTVSVDGQQIGGTFMTSAVNWEGQSQQFNFFGDWGSGSHQVAITFLNDAGVTATTQTGIYSPGDAFDIEDRNLWILGATYDGTATPNAWSELQNNGTQNLTVSGTTPGGGGGSPDTLVLRLSEDAYQGDAQFTIAVNGTTIGGTQTVGALHATGASQDITLTGNWGPGPLQIGVSFLNDAYGGTSDTDRNLYVDGIQYNGQTYANTTAALPTEGTQTFTVGGTTPTTQGPAATFTVQLAEDAYQGDAQFAVSVDGTQISDPLSVTASHAAGQWQDFSFSGDLSSGQHQIGITFANDAYGGDATTDRNLYIGGVQVNGTQYTPTTTALYSDGTSTITVPFAS